MGQNRNKEQRSHGQKGKTIRCYCSFHMSLIFSNFISKLSSYPRFSFVIALTVINKVNDFSVSRDLWENNLFKIDAVVGVAVPGVVS